MFASPSQRAAGREIAGLEWNRADLERQTAWLDQTKNGTPRGVPLNRDAVAVLEGERGKNEQYFTFRGQPIRYELTNTAWQNAVRKAGLTDLRFHDLRHTWASWAAMNGVRLEDIQQMGGWATSQMVQRYRHLSPEHLAEAAARVKPVSLRYNARKAGKSPTA